jgi:hypothetical protein
VGLDYAVPNRWSIGRHNVPQDDRSRIAVAYT